ncbi:MAG: thioredoxin family protein [bacterium]|nr:thioredoxin family protein [bacterium]
MSLTYSTMSRLGMKAPDFQLMATDGKTWSLADFAGHPTLLVVFTCNHCPYARAVEERLIRIGRDYIPKGLAMAAINSNDAAVVPEDSFDNMRLRAREKGFPYPYCRDETQQTAHAYGAACTPDPFLFDAGRKLVYRGRVDDNWQHPEKVSRSDLREAIEAVLAGRPPRGDQMASMGCNIKWK